MDVGLLRLVWSVIEETSPSNLQGASGGEQIRLLLHRIEKRITLSQQERSQVHRYLLERIPLIQDLLGQVM